MSNRLETNVSLSLGELIKLFADFRGAQPPTAEAPKGTPKVGEKWFFRCVTYHCVGEIVAMDKVWVVLRDASWVADTNRLMQTVEDGSLLEVEPIGDMVVKMDAIVDGFPWCHDLPTEQI